MTDSVVDRLHGEFRALVELLDHHSEPSLRVVADDCFRKALLLTAASHFEMRIVNTVLHWVAVTSENNERLVELVRRKALSRQYHALFDWDTNNANRFFAWFGDTFKNAVDARIKADPELQEGIRAFLEIGRERNRMVHQDFGSFSLEKTADEIFRLYEKARRFADSLSELLEASEAEDESALRA